MLEIYLAAVVFLVAVLMTATAGLYLPAFFVLCYMLPFLPLLAAPFGGDSVFWPTAVFIFPADAWEVSALSQIWLVSSIGLIVGLWASRVRMPFLVWRRGEYAQNLAVKAGSLQRLVALVLVASLVSVRFFFGIDAESNSAFRSMELVICALLLLCWTFALYGRHRIYFVLTVGLFLLYAWSQVRTGDRDFFTVAIALMLMGVMRVGGGRGRLLTLGLVGMLLLLIGAVISMVRMDVEITPASLLEFLAFNSWNATILPVIWMVQAEWTSDFLLYGKTYLDLLTSVVPSPIFHLYGLEKPIHLDNPAFWFQIPNMGGMHAAGVALRNFGLIGVGVQCAVLTYMYCRLEHRCRSRPTMWSTFLYLCIAASVMHTVWYGLIAFFNTLLLVCILYFIFSIRVTVFKSETMRLKGT